MEELSLSITAWMQGSFGLAVLACFLWGLASVLLCPCHVASIPLIIGYVGGQGAGVGGRRAAFYAGLFSLGLVASISAIGVACAALGRALGEISHFWGVPIGLIIIVLGLSLSGALSLPSPAARLGGKAFGGAPGAIALGLLFGILSGACTFGFLAPMLAVIGTQEAMLPGVLLIFAFAVGHCLPILIAGASVAFLQKILHSSGIRMAGAVGRVVAGCLVVAVGAYLVTEPFFHNH